jgi:hypothetical protein
MRRKSINVRTGGTDGFAGSGRGSTNVEGPMKGQGIDT